MLRGKRVLLRLVRQEDLAEMRALLLDGENLGADESLEVLTASTQQNEFNTGGFWEKTRGSLLITTHDGALLGEIGYLEGLAFQVGFEVGFRIYKPDNRGKGYMTEALALFCAYLFALHDIPRLQAHCLLTNVASRRVLERGGFKLEGVCRQMLFEAGRYHDLYQFSLLHNECPRLEDVAQGGRHA